MEELAERVAREKAAYDHGTIHAESSKLHRRFRHVFECPNSQGAERYLDQIVNQSAGGKDLLDYGCYDGWMTPRYLNAGPRSITGLDISETAIAAANAKYSSVATFRAGDAHVLPFPSESFDIIVGRAILHHLDFDLAIRELVRVLRPSGKAIFYEPLGDNPGAKLLRVLTPKARTMDEKPLSRSEIQRADAVFGQPSHLFVGLVSVPVAMLTSLTPLHADNFLLHLADRADRGLAHTPLKYWMRQVLLVWQKTK
jgi:SAM-dependent methyltransferase